MNAKLQREFYTRSNVVTIARDLLGDRVWLEQGRTIPRSQIASGPRIGIDYAEEWVDKPWRFWIRDNPFVSRR